MKKTLLIILLFSAKKTFAQKPLEYANFIQTDTAVKWAAIYSSYVNLTPVNPNFGIRNFYYNKFKQNKTVVYTEDSADFTVTAKYAGYSELKSSIHEVRYDPFKMNWRFDYDDSRNAYSSLFYHDSNECDSCFMVNTFSFFKIKQLLFYKNNKLQIKNILINPIIYTKKDGSDEENNAYFETLNLAFDSAQTDDGNIPAAAMYMGRSCNRLNLNPVKFNTESRILTLTNWSLAEILYRGIKKNILKAYRTDQSVYPNIKNILSSKGIEEYMSPVIEVPTFDSLGNPTGMIKMRNERNPDSLTGYTLIQDFYFDFSKEILYSKIIALAPRIKIITPQGLDLGETNYWGIIFPENKKPLIKARK